MKRLKYAAKQVLRYFGVEVRRGSGAGPPGWLENAGPVTCQYLFDYPIAPAMPVSLEDCRAGVMAYPVVPCSAHPLVLALEAAQAAEGHEIRRSAIRMALQRYYESVQPFTAADVLGVPEQEAPGLIGAALHSWVFPWSERSIEGIAAHRRTCLEEEGLSYGRSLSLADGGTFYGPVSAGKLDLETARIADLHRTFAARGFQPGLGPAVEVYGLKSDAGFRWLIVQGQHRLAACAAFGIERVEVKVTRLIRRDDADFWPHVVSGTFTRNGALRCFDRIFAGEPTPAARHWTASQHRGEKPKSSSPVYHRGLRNDHPEPAWARESAARHAMEG